jgi:hypothetical protein
LLDSAADEYWRMTTQSLAYIEPQLSLPLARIYNAQQNYDGLTRGIVQAMYLHPPNFQIFDPAFEAFAASVVIYYGDVTLMEPELLSRITCGLSFAIIHFWKSRRPELPLSTL